jgi:hypothetical protein
VFPSLLPPDEFSEWQTIERRRGTKPFTEEHIKFLSKYLVTDRPNDPYLSIEYKQTVARAYRTGWRNDKKVRSVFKYKETQLLRRIKQSTVLYTYLMPFTSDSEYQHAPITKDNVVQITTLALEQRSDTEALILSEIEDNQVYGAYPPKKYEGNNNLTRKGN